MVAALAVFFGPLVARANTQRQIQVTAREAWMREFREHVAQFIAGTANTDHVTAGTREAGEVHADGDARATRLVIGELVENVRATQSSTSAVRLLIAEKGAQYVEFVEVMNRLHAVALAASRSPICPSGFCSRESVRSKCRGGHLAARTRCHGRRPRRLA